MKRLYAPWRSSYVKTKDTSCPFCAAVTTRDDAQSFVLARFDGVLVMLNRYPYNAGHLLVIPHAHEADLSALTQEVRSQIMEATNRCIQVLQEKLGCKGVNVGFNFGECSGGSIPDHLHMHILPRWQGDTNFLATIGTTKLVSFDLEEMYEKLKDAF